MLNFEELMYANNMLMPPHVTPLPELPPFYNYKGIENILTSFIGNSKESNKTLSWLNTDHLIVYSRMPRINK